MTASSPSRAAAIGSAAAILGGCLFLAVSRKLGWLEPETARLVAGLGFALLLVLGGNALPKAVTEVSTDRTAHGKAQRADRHAGLSLVVGGLAAVVAWLALPDQVALVTSSVVTLGATGLAALLLARGGRLRPHPGSARGGLFQILLALAGVAVIFLLDVAWGDRAAQWTAVVFVLGQGALATWLGRCGTRDGTAWGR